MLQCLAPPQNLARGRMICSNCSTGNPEFSRYCAACGEELGSSSGSPTRRRSGAFAVSPGEPVLSASVLSTLLPHTTGARSSVYRHVTVLALLIPIIAAAFGLLSFAIVSAAVIVPVLYLVYLYDLNIWEDEPIGVIVGCVVVSAVIGTFFTLLWRNVAFERVQLPVNVIAGRVSMRELVVMALVVPIGVILLSQIGPILLSSRPRFDEMLDGLTFGVISGATFIGAETIVAHHALISSTPARVNRVDAGLFISVVANAGLVRPLFFGCLVGYMMAEFSGLGAGPGRVSGRYLRAVLESTALAIVFCVGVYMFGLVQGSASAFLGLVWAIVMLVVAALRLRVRLHDALLEEALEAVSLGSADRDHAIGRTECPHCEMPMLSGSRFCNQCGMSELATSKTLRSGPPGVGVPVGAIAIDSTEGAGR
jgi:hypothetical protein